MYLKYRVCEATSSFKQYSNLFRWEANKQTNMIRTSALGFGAGEHAPEELQMQRVLWRRSAGRAVDNSAHLLCDLRERKEGRGNRRPTYVLTCLPTPPLPPNPFPPSIFIFPFTGAEKCLATDLLKDSSLLPPWATATLLCLYYV